ncbi:hypothetical protein D3C71_1284470 [compost metagenome]
MHLLQRRHARAQRIRQAPHGIGQHDQHPGGDHRRVGERQVHALEHAQVADRQHQPRDGQRGRGQVVEPAARRQLRAQDQVGDRGADHHVQPRRDEAVQQRVAYHLLGVGEHRGVVLQRVGIGQHREAPHLGERHQQNADVRRQRDQQDDHDPSVGQHRLPRRQPPALQRAAALLQGGVVLALHHARRHPQREDREGDHDHADHIAQRVVDAHRGDAQVGLGREHVGHAHHQRRAQVVEHLHEDQGRTGQVAGHGQRKDHPAEQPPAARAQVQGRLFHGPVDVAHGRHQVQQNERKVVDALDEGHAH